MLTLSLSEFLVSNFIELIQSLFQSHEGDGAFLFWSKEILGASLILALFWVLAQLAVLILNKWGTRLTSFTSTDLDLSLIHI